MQVNVNKIHFIGICGVAMSALAIAFQKKGYTVTGSDAGFYPPVSTNLEKNGITFYPGWHPDKMCENGEPDLVVVGNVASSTNPEWVYVKEHGLHYVSYPEAVAKYFLGKNSLVAAGTYGKTTSTSLLSWILTKAKMDPSYMFGGIATSETDSACISASHEWSVLEGDEYKTSQWDMRPKFALYAPTHLLLTSVSWDHADVYKTEKDYLDAFKKLVASVPPTGFVVGCFEGHNMEKVLVNCKANMIIYGKTPEADYAYKDIQQNQKGIQFDIVHKKKIYHVKSPLLGEFNAENITGCFAMAHTLGIDDKIILKAITTFHGLKRRLEKRVINPVTVIDDIAHSPAKASATLETLRKIYKQKIIVVFEPNTGNRKRQAIPQYKNAFTKADVVVIPRLTKLKIDPKDLELPLDGQELAEVIAQTHPTVEYIDEDTAVIEFLQKNTAKGDVIVFLGSHGFRGMIENLVEVLH